jgi:hypothetical protein
VAKEPAQLSKKSFEEIQTVCFKLGKEAGKSKPPCRGSELGSLEWNFGREELKSVTSSPCVSFVRDILFCLEIDGTNVSASYSRFGRPFARFSVSFGLNEC